MYLKGISSTAGYGCSGEACIITIIIIADEPAEIKMTAQKQIKKQPSTISTTLRGGQSQGSEQVKHGDLTQTARTAAGPADGRTSGRGADLRARQIKCHCLEGGVARRPITRRENKGGR